MKLINQLLHQIANPILTHDERAQIRCQLAKQLEEAGNYESAREAMGELWKNFSLKEAMRRYEARIIERALKDADGIVTRAAQLLGFNHHNSLINLLNTKHRELLPARTPIEPRRRSLISVRDEQKETRAVTILHVENDGLVARAVRDTLKREGWTVETCADGTAALQILSGEDNYDVLIFDNTLPSISGVALIYEARRLAHRQQTPIIMLSAGNVEREALQAGADAFLRKPEDVTTLAETIARLLARSPKHVNKHR